MSRTSGSRVSGPVLPAAFACALLAKPMAVSLPVVLLLLDAWPLPDTILYYGWYLLKRRWDKVRRYEFLLFGILLAAIILDSGTTGTFIYFQF